jgi:hypothetical protein
MPANSFAQLEALNQARHIRTPRQLQYRFNIKMAMTFLVPLQSWHNLMSEDCWSSDCKTVGSTGGEEVVASGKGGSYGRLSNNHATAHHGKPACGCWCEKRGRGCAAIAMRC